MTNQMSPDPAGQGGQDPWAAFGYLVAGVTFYGVVGWGLDSWLNVQYLLPVGIVVGMLFGMYMVFARYRFRGGDESATSATNVPVKAPIENERPAQPQADRDDRGDMQ